MKSSRAEPLQLGGGGVAQRRGTPRAPPLPTRHLLPVHTELFNATYGPVAAFWLGKRRIWRPLAQAAGPPSVT